MFILKSLAIMPPLQWRFREPANGKEMVSDETPEEMAQFIKNHRERNGYDKSHNESLDIQTIINEINQYNAQLTALRFPKDASQWVVEVADDPTWPPCPPLKGCCR